MNKTSLQSGNWMLYSGFPIKPGMTGSIIPGLKDIIHARPTAL
ncbi:MAG: hypothetical protein PHI68_05465 [Candidatus Cloacimonetes bacterium]|nr:hypothetical protein [Candidatus Cloacimonadota bacterium]